VNRLKIVDRLLNDLRNLPGARAEFSQPPPTKPDQPNYSFDATIHLTLDEAKIALVVEAKKALYPRDVRSALWSLKKYCSEVAPQDADEVVPLLAAESLSPGAKDLLKSEHVGFYDSGGSLFVPAKHAYVFVDRPPPKAMAKAIRSLFTGQRAQVLHALLAQDRHWWSVKEMAQQALVSPATASETLQELERLDWMHARGQGPTKERQLNQPAALLGEWSKQHLLAPPPPPLRYFVPNLKGEQLAADFARLCETNGVEYTLTSEVAAQRYAPYLSTITQVRARLAANPAAENVLAQLKAKAVTEGANLVIIDAKSKGDFLFKKRVGEAWLASPIQVYLDLLVGEGRAKDMADHLRREVIGF
jgi:hypothetical protein